MPKRLTQREQAAIKQLRKVAANWPQSLMLFSNSGTLLVLKQTVDPPPRLRNEVACIYGIPNDGGDADQ